MASGTELEEKQREIDKALSKQVGLDYGLSLFDAHPSGMQLSKESIAILRDAADVLKSVPAWTVVLRGHCPGRPEENNLIRESVGEEAADLCKNYLQKAGVANNILCEGQGSAQGLGMCVSMSALAPKEIPGPASDPIEDLIRDVVPDEAVVPADDKSKEEIAAQELEAAKKEAARKIQSVQRGKMARQEVENVKQESKARVDISVNIAVDTDAQPAPQQTMPETPATKPFDFAETATKPFDFAETQPAITTRAETEGGSLSERIDNAEKRASMKNAEMLTPRGEVAVAKDLLQDTDPAAGLPPQPDAPLRAETMGNALLGTAGAAASAPPENSEADDFPVPDTSGMTIEEKAKLLDELLDKILETSIAFEPNKAEVHRRGMRTVRQLARVLHAFPSFTVRCVGHSKGRPADNNDAKKQLSQARAEAVKGSLLKENVPNDIICTSYGSALGRGMCVRLHVLSPEEKEDIELNVPRVDNMSREQQEASLNQLLKEALDRGLAFEPNKASIQADGASVIKQVHGILRGFPGWMIRCEGHAKGLPADNNDAKQQLSQVRAEAVRAALEALGTTNSIYCLGLGSTHGLGMCVRMFAMDPDKDIEIPDVTSLSEEERAKILDSLLEQVLERNIEFEPNKSEIPTSARVTINSLAKVLKAFPTFTIRCEGHTKGLPADNNEAKRKLSHARAESVNAAMKAAGATNRISCIGVGSSQGRGMCVRMFVIDPEELKKDEIVVPETAGMSEEEQTVLLNQLLETALQRNIDFEPNVYEIPATAFDTIQNIAEVLKKFPDFTIRCEGHAKGQPTDNTEAKKKLSHMRAEAVKAAVAQKGATNGIHCVGEGCSKGLGMRVRMFVIDPEELKKDEIQIPDTSGMTTDERRTVVNELLSKALEKNISFEPNKAQIQAAGVDVVKSLAHVLKAFTDFSVRCEGHAKGKPADNNEAKVKLSQVRAEAVAAALNKEGVTNNIVCVGQGCAQGLGMCVRMFAMEDDASESKPDS